MCRKLDDFKDQFPWAIKFKKKGVWTTLNRFQTLEAAEKWLIDIQCDGNPDYQIIKG